MLVSPLIREPLITSLCESLETACGALRAMVAGCPSCGGRGVLPLPQSINCAVTDCLARPCPHCHQGRRVLADVDNAPDVETCAMQEGLYLESLRDFAPRQWEPQ